MDKVLNWLRAAGAFIGGVLTFLIGYPDYWLYAFIAFMVMDYISGISAAFIDGTISSRKGFHGIIKKIMMLVPVMVAHILDTAMDAGGVLRNAVMGFLVANEGLSILENTARCGVPWPKKLVAALEQLRGEDG